MYQSTDEPDVWVYRGEFVNGVPEDVFDLQNDDIGNEFPQSKYYVDEELRSFRIFSENGRTLQIQRSKDFFLVEDVTDPVGQRFIRFEFSASVLGHSMELLMMQNRGWQGDRTKHHPDLYPAKVLAARVLKYFEGHGYDIQTISGVWYKEHKTLSDNHDAYRLALHNIQVQHFRADKEPRDQDKRAAALLTPLGKMAGGLGYGVVASFDDASDNLVTVSYRKGD